MPPPPPKATKDTTGVTSKAPTKGESKESKVSFEQLTSILGTCSTKEKLRETIAQYRGSFDALHHSYVCTLAARFGARDLFVDHVQLLLACDPAKTGRDARNASGALHGAAKLKLFHHPVLPQILSEVVRLCGDMNTQNVSNSFWAMGTLGVSEDCYTRPVALRAAALAPTFNSQDCSNCLWAAATLGLDEPGVITPIARQAGVLAEGGGKEDIIGQGAANCLWAVGVLGVRDPAITLPLARSAAALAPSFPTSRDALRSLTAAAALGMGGEKEVVTALARAALGHIGGMNPGELSMCLGAAADLGVKEERLRPLLLAVVGVAGSLRPEGCATSLRALGWLGCRDPAIVTPIATATAAAAPHFLSNLDAGAALWGAVALGLRDPKVFTPLAWNYSRCASLQGTAQALGACADLGVYDPPLLTHLATVAAGGADLYCALLSTTALRALAVLGVSDGCYTGPVAAAAARTAPHMTPKEAAAALGAAGVLGLRDNAVLTPLLREGVVRTLGGMGGGEVAQTLWALAVLGGGNPGLVPLFSMAVVRILKKGGSSGQGQGQGVKIRATASAAAAAATFTRGQARTILRAHAAAGDGKGAVLALDSTTHQALLRLADMEGGGGGGGGEYGAEEGDEEEEEGGEGVGEGEGEEGEGWEGGGRHRLTRGGGQSATATATAKASGAGGGGASMSPSAFRASVKDALAEGGLVEVAVRVPVLGGLLVVDLVVTTPSGLKVHINVDGQEKFLRVLNKPGAVGPRTGSVILRGRLEKRLEGPVLNVPFYQWAAKGQEERVEYLFSSVFACVEAWEKGDR